MVLAPTRIVDRDEVHVVGRVLACGWVWTGVSVWVGSNIILACSRTDDDLLGRRRAIPSRRQVEAGPVDQSQPDSAPRSVSSPAAAHPESAPPAAAHSHLSAQLRLDPASYIPRLQLGQLVPEPLQLGLFARDGELLVVEALAQRDLLVLEVRGRRLVLERRRLRGGALCGLVRVVQRAREDFWGGRRGFVSVSSSVWTAGNDPRQLHTPQLIVYPVQGLCAFRLVLLDVALRLGDLFEV